MYSELHEFYKNFIIENIIYDITWKVGSNADFGGMTYAYIKEIDLYLYDMSTLTGELEYIVSKRTDNGNEIEYNDLFCFDTEIDHISLLIDFINKI